MQLNTSIRDENLIFMLIYGIIDMDTQSGVTLRPRIVGYKEKGELIMFNKYTQFINAVKTLNPDAHLTFADHLAAICSSKFRKEFLKQEDTAAKAIRAANYQKDIQDALEFNTQLLTSIIANCPQDHLIWMKFPCGNWSREDLEADVPRLAKAATETEKDLTRRDFWGYSQGGGQIVINPDPYGRDPARIADAIWTPNPWLDGNRIKAWRYLPKVKTE